MKDDRRLILTPFSEIAPEEVEWIWPGALGRGLITLLVGDGEAGKTYIAVDLAARLSQTGLMPDGHQTDPGQVVLLEAEDSAGNVRRRLDRQHANPARVYCPQVFSGKELDHFSLGQDRARLEKLLPPDTRLVIISSINSYMPQTKNVNLETDVRSILLPWARVAKERNFAVLGIMHLTKDRERAAVQQIMGSGAYAHVARIILGMVGEVAAADGARVIGGLKSNYGEKLVSWTITIDDEGLQWGEDRPDLDIKALMETFTPRDADVATTHHAKAATLLMDWIPEKLYSTAELKERAKRAGIQWHTVQRVRAKSRKDIVTVEKDGLTYWMVQKNNTAAT